MGGAFYGTQHGFAIHIESGVCTNSTYKCKTAASLLRPQGVNFAQN
jgi:hypothetical protein